MKYFILAVLLFILFSIGFSCTIGIASGDVTSNGRPLIWKTRDIASFPDNMLAWDENSDIGFIYVKDFRDSLAWMGMNQKGFCIVNSFVERQVQRPIFNNGSLMFHLLGNCATIAEMDALLDTLNISDQVLSGNFAVMDSTGSVAMYEISWTEIDKYDVADVDDGYLVRTNFSLISGGDDGIERYQRSVMIIDELIAGDNLDAAHLMQDHVRDFSDDLSNPVNVPYEGKWFNDRPWGYIKSNVSIARGIAASSVIMEGLIPDEKAETTTMYALLGQPAVSVFLPFWAIGSLPMQVIGENSSQITDSANLLKNMIFNYPQNSYYVDSYNLLEDGHERIWDHLFPFEEEMRTAVAEFIPQWRNGILTADNAELLSEEWAYRGAVLLDSLTAYVSMQVEADFSVVNNSGGAPLTVFFQEKSRHYPNAFQWDFDNDGTYDMVGETNPLWTYQNPGTYSVRLFASNAVSDDEYILEGIIQVNDSPANETELSPIPLLLGNYPNPFIMSDQRTASTQINFYLPQAGSDVVLDIYNQRGQKVLQKEFADTLKAGLQSWNWDGRNSNGSYVSSGIYLYKLSSGAFQSETGKLTVIK